MKNVTEKLTIENVIGIVVHDLEAISIPMAMIDSIGIPLARSIKNLKVCIEALEMEASRRNEEATAQTEPEEKNDGRETDAE